MEVIKRLGKGFAKAVDRSHKWAFNKGPSGRYVQPTHILLIRKKKC